jgi:hypothetical protein
MAQEAESALGRSGQVLRELASHQGAAYRRYGEALEKFGAGELAATELFKTAGDLYLKEAERVAASAFQAGVDVFSFALGKAGVKPLDDESGVAATEKKTTGATRKRQ